MGTLSFTVVTVPETRGLEAMVPMRTDHAALLQITQEGNPVRFTTETIKGLE